ncbi:hypothetical protein MIND_01209800 [Mycena indigotica]|uniref:C2H2-type domain-containing protein n=1 Tax=Mycena indigotica TaxID=2126181 RepID=A0A8H6S571_9AGAR|nr:uncharacterized protein MIND_01209800 [Mycena indigotica]KAF7293104.1 hypothetical protein MIND_01209800 [Mycena indigotica]
MSSGETLRCRICEHPVNSAKGLRSHYSQKTLCRERLGLILAAERAAVNASTLSPSPSPSRSPMAIDNPFDFGANQADAPAFAPDDVPGQPPTPAASDQPAQVKDLDDPDNPDSPRWREDYPEAGKRGEKGKSRFEEFRAAQAALGLPPWSPFDSEADWALARWMVEVGLSKRQIEAFLKLDMIKNGAKPSYTSAYTLFQKIDSLPNGPGFVAEFLTITGDLMGDDGKPMTEELEFWHRDALECLEEIMANPAHEKSTHYAPQHVYRDAEGEDREYSEMYTGDTWWELQGLIPVGHTVIPVIIGADETQLSRFSGDKKAWPVYIAPANVDSDIRRKPSSHATILLGYVPVSKFHCFSKAKRGAARYQLYHSCMRKMLQSLVAAGKDGVKMLCPDQYFRDSHPLLVAQISDHPERCLSSCCAENRCEFCTVPDKQRGGTVPFPPRNPAETLRVLQEEADGLKPAAFDALGLRRTDPFWSDLPHCNIFRSFYPDLLHQLHKGVFKDHTVAWATASLNYEFESQKEAEIDKRFQAMPDHPSLRHFRQGISLVSQWTGNEHKNMEKVFLGVLNGTGNKQVLLAVRAILDFIYYAHFEAHTEASLKKLAEAWLSFHEHKQVFLDMGIREHFNIPKVHAMWHYVALIRLGGSTGGFSTELSERLHIDCAKLGYRASQPQELYCADGSLVDSTRVNLALLCLFREPLDEEDLDDEEDLGTGQGTPVVVDSDEHETPTISDVPPIHPPPFKVAKTAPVDFLRHLKLFMDEYHIPLPGNFDSIATRFPVYKRVTVTIPPVVQVSRTSILDPIRATPVVPAHDLHKSVPAHFDTILAYKSPPLQISRRLSLDGLFPARVRAIFALPIEYGIFKEPLAYVEWYKPLTSKDEVLGMYKIAPATINNRRRASIIPVSLINRSCHLIPRFTQHIQPGLTSETVLDVAKDFLLNPYLRHIDFVLLRGVE